MAVDHATDIRRTITGLVLAAIVVLALVLRGWVLLALIPVSYTHLTLPTIA